MAKIVIKDLETNLELDRKAMTSIMGGRGSGYRQAFHEKAQAYAGIKQSVKGSFCGSGINIHSLFRGNR